MLSGSISPIYEVAARLPLLALGTGLTVLRALSKACERAQAADNIAPPAPFVRDFVPAWLVKDVALPSLAED